MENLTKCYCGHTTTCDCEPEQDFKDIELPQQERPETLEEAAERYADKSFIPMRNSDGEPLRIPLGQSVPCGFTKHKKVATKHFINGAKWQQENSNINALNFEIDSLKREIKVLKHQQERSYSEKDLILFYNFLKEKCDTVNTSGYAETHVKWFIEQFKKK